MVSTISLHKTNSAYYVLELASDHMLLGTFENAAAISSWDMSNSLSSSKRDGP